MRNKKGQFSAGSKHLVTHGKSADPIYRVWRSMLARCCNPKNPAYGNYGGRGILVCERWLRFENFYEDMGDRPIGLSLDRIDNDLGYSPSNCRWASRRTQNLNQRGRVSVTVGDRTASLVEWSEISGLRLHTICARIRSGWDPVLAVTAPRVTKRKGVPRGERIIQYGDEHGVEWTGPNMERAA